MNFLRSNLSKYFLYKGGRFYLLIMLVTLVVSSFLGYKIPDLLLLLSKNYGNGPKFYNAIQLFAIFYVAVYVNRVFYQLAVNYYMKNLIDTIRTNLYKIWILNYDVQTKDKVVGEYPQGEVMARIMSDTQALQELIRSGAFGIIIDFVFVLFFLISFVKLDTMTGCFLAFTEILAAGLLVWGSRYMTAVFISVRRSKGMVSRTMANLVGGLKDGYFIENFNYAKKKGTIYFNDFLKKQLKANIWDASYFSLAESLYPCLLALVVVVFPYSKIVEAAVILALVELIQRSINPIKSISSKIANIQNALTGIHRINEFTLDLERGFSSPLESERQSIGLKKLEVEINYFSYPSKKRLILDDKLRKDFSLKNIRFSGEKGQLIGVVGLSGSGKSTLLNIVSANIIPEKGFIKLIKENDEEVNFPGKGVEDIVAYREQVGIASQESHIFSESLAFNICMNSEIPDDFFLFWDWICEKISYLKKWGIGAETKISPRTLSLGQNQLVSAIRSCYLKKNIVLFDEISSALDSELEKALREVILLIQKNSLTIIVAHRIETTIEADNIIVLDEGKMVDQGTHQVLLNESLKYQEFIDGLAR